MDLPFSKAFLRKDYLSRTKTASAVVALTLAILTLTSVYAPIPLKFKVAIPFTLFAVLIPYIYALRSRSRAGVLLQLTEEGISLPRFLFSHLRKTVPYEAIYSRREVQFLKQEMLRLDFVGGTYVFSSQQFERKKDFEHLCQNIHENKAANQIDLFGADEEQDNEIVLNIEDWKFEDRLSREFEAIGFFISDHPLNQFKEIFDDYKIVDYIKFNSDDNIKDANIAATLLKISERKTAKGNSYAVIKFTDLTSVFELFIFSDILELNREILIEGNSLIITLIKTISNDENKLKRINVQKIASLKDLFNKPVCEIAFNIKTVDDIEKISKLLNEEGTTEVKINLETNDNNISFKLKNRRLIDRKAINLLRKDDISIIIQ